MASGEAVTDGFAAFHICRQPAATIVAFPVKQERGEIQSRGGDGNSKAEVLTTADLKQGELGELQPTG
jgi:hypothetical protein